MAYKQVGYPVTSSHTVAVLEPGTIWEDGATGKAYRYVLIEDAAVANGDVVEFSDTSGYEVTKDRAGGASTRGHGYTRAITVSGRISCDCWFGDSVFPCG